MMDLMTKHVLEQRTEQNILEGIIETLEKRAKEPC